MQSILWGMRPTQMRMETRMNIWILVDEYDINYTCAGANVLSAYSSENDANDALEAIAKEHGEQVFRSEGTDVMYTVFRCDDEDYVVYHRVYVCQTQLI